MIMRFDYLISGVRIGIESEYWICEERESRQFLTDGMDEEVKISVHFVHEIPQEKGTLCSFHREHPVYRDGNQISRISWDLFREAPHARFDYDLDHPNEGVCYIREDDIPWATKGKYFWPGIGLNSLLLHQNVLMMHASYVIHHGLGILFTAPSGVGKSTQAHLWNVHRDAKIINGDKAAIRVGDQIVCHGLPFSGTSGISANVSAPLKAIVVLSQGKENIVSRLSVREAVAAIYPNIFVDSAVPEEAQLALKLLLDILASFPVYHLSCTPDENAVQALENVLFHSESR